MDFSDNPHGRAYGLTNGTDRDVTRKAIDIYIH